MDIVKGSYAVLGQSGLLCYSQANTHSNLSCCCHPQHLDFFCHLDLELMQFLQMDKNLATTQLHEHGGKDFGILDEILYAILCNIWL